MIRRHALLLILALLAGPAAARAADGVVVLPSSIDLGEWPAGKATEAAVWLINGGDRPVSVLDAVAHPDAIVAPALNDRTIAPMTALEVRLIVTAPALEGQPLNGRVRFTMAGGKTHDVDLTLVAANPRLHLAPPEAAGSPWLPVRVAPLRLDLPPMPPGQTAVGTFWVINTSDRPRRLGAVKGSCGCVSFPEFAPTTIPAGRIVPIEVAMIAQSSPGREQLKHATFLVDGEAPITTKIAMPVIDQLEARVRRLLDALAAGDSGSARVLLAIDSRVWLERREGPGERRNERGEGPWAEWNRVMHAEAVYDGFTVDGQTVTAELVAINDFHRLLDRPAARTRVTFFFNDDREIDGTLYVPEPNSVAHDARWNQFLEWARRHRPAELDAIYPNERIVPSRDAAERWRALLIEWRAAAEIPPAPIGGS